jgi:hypothetical protein
MTKCPTMATTTATTTTTTMTMDRMREIHRKLCIEMSNHLLVRERFSDERGDKCSTNGENPAMNAKSVKQIG